MSQSIFSEMAFLPYFSSTIISTRIPPSPSRFLPIPISVDPGYNSFHDLHTIASPLNNLGLPFSHVPVDFDGETRSLTQPDIGADEFVPFNPNAGTQLPRPAICNGSDAIVSLKNWGSAPLTSVTINWRVNGTLQSPVNWTGNLAPGTTTQVALGTVPSSGITLETWTTLPNGMPDPFTANDTAFLADVYPGLAGTYTIGGITPDFPTIRSAATALVQGGVCGPVVFNIRDGSYREHFLIDYLPGNSPVNTVTFQSENRDSALVQIWQDYPDTADWIMRLHSVSNMIFRDLTFHNRGTISGDVIHCFLGENFTFENCKIRGYPSTTSSGTWYALRIGLQDSLVTVRNCYISGRGLRIDHHRKQQLFTKYPEGDG